MSTLRDWAAYYAKRGWPVFPLHTPTEGVCSCRNPDCSSPGKHPRIMNGVKGATLDLDQIAKWWDTWPDANIGLAAGRGLLVIDVDVDKGGDDVLRSLAYAPETPTSHTGGGGMHYLVSLSEGMTIGNKAGILPGVDLRGEGGYIVAPPSLHASGKRYVWDVEYGPKTALAPTPGWVLQQVARRCPEEEPPDNLELHEGARNDKLFRLGCYLRDHGICEMAIADCLMVINQTHCLPPLGEREVFDIAASTVRYDPTHSTVMPSHWLEGL